MAAVASEQRSSLGLICEYKYGGSLPSPCLDCISCTCQALLYFLGWIPLASAFSHSTAASPKKLLGHRLTWGNNRRKLPSFYCLSRPWAEPSMVQETHALSPSNTSPEAHQAFQCAARDKFQHPVLLFSTRFLQGSGFHMKYLQELPSGIT